MLTGARMGDITAAGYVLPQRPYVFAFAIVLGIVTGLLDTTSG